MSNIGASYYDNIAQKRYSTIVPWMKLGFNPDIKNVEEDLIPQGGVYTFPASATKMDLVSSDDNDGKTGSPSSTGARTVTIYGLLADKTEASETLTMNGTTKVTTANTYLRINNMRVATVGAGGVPIGNISLSETGGTTYKYGYIRAGYTRQRTLIYTVPAGKTMYITSTTLSAVCGAVGHWTKFTFRATYDDKSDTVLPAGFYMPYAETSIVESAFERHFAIPFRLPAGTDIKMSAICDGTVVMLCESVLRAYITTP
jgi:hypothetical protein